MKVIVIAGTASGVGKTTIATGVMGALARRSLKVQPFKAGPDYIDPSYHSCAAGVPSRNLDTWMLPREAVRELFSRAMSGKDIGIVEGVMGLYDGRSASNDEGSTAELAKLLHAPVILVVDASCAARSVAATVKGFRVFDPQLDLAGVIFNGIGTPEHFALCREAVEENTGVAVLGYLPRRIDLELPERHLGLVPTAEGTIGKDFFDSLSAQVEATVDISRLVAVAEQAAPPAAGAGLFPAQRIPIRARLAVARDKAFSFYYQDGLDLLEAWGMEIVPFSPLADSGLPSGIDGIYLGGGFPELYAGELAVNEPMKLSVRHAAENGLPVYAECGGLMYLGCSLRDFRGCEYAMVGALPFSSCLDSPNGRLTLGYRTVRALGDSPLLRRGETARGHEFHRSAISGYDTEANAYEVQEPSAHREGFQKGNVFATYIHLHPGSRPGMAHRFVDYCAGKGNGLLRPAAGGPRNGIVAKGDRQR